jgi:hypothetical protein
MSFSSMKVAELRDVLFARGLPTAGKKAELLARVLASADTPAAPVRKSGRARKPTAESVAAKAQEAIIREHGFDRLGEGLSEDPDAAYKWKQQQAEEAAAAKKKAAPKKRKAAAAAAAAADGDAVTAPKKRAKKAAPAAKKAKPKAAAAAKKAKPKRKGKYKGWGAVSAGMLLSHVHSFVTFRVTHTPHDRSILCMQLRFSAAGRRQRRRRRRPSGR